VIVPRNGVIPGTMSQQMDYFEVPLELKYSLLNSRFGLNMIGGMSTLILSGNEINVNSDGFTTKIGEANNLNTLSFSTNIGLGFDYKLTKRFIFNLEPMFKYQINPYSDTSIDFKPYYLGVYTGFSYRF
ncbi:MAG: outer membrane beta-barrel protein, partial [Flavobacteriales bacterium]|nr:outer membrane beta-barrel protein [Flavobacteriales bacterium]